MRQCPWSTKLCPAWYGDAGRFVIYILQALGYPQNRDTGLQKDNPLQESDYVVQSLILAGANIEIVDYEGKTPVDLVETPELLERMLVC